MRPEKKRHIVEQNCTAIVTQVNPNALTARNERLALSINTYNAFVVKGILDQYSQVNDVGRYRYFIGRGYSVGDKTVNLYDLERKVVVDGKNSDGGFVRLGGGGAGCASTSSK